MATLRGKAASGPFRRPSAIDEGVLTIGVCGGSGSGKTTFATLLHRRLGDGRCSLLQQDAYYRDLSEGFDHDGGSVNFDHPDAIDFDLLAVHLAELKARRPVEMPVYDFRSHRRPVIVLEGMLILSRQAVRDTLDVRVFVEAPEQVRLQRRLARDVDQRGRDPDGVAAQFSAHVKPMHDRFVEPSRAHAHKVYSGEEPAASNVEDLLLSLQGLLRGLCDD
jgi:uridine kinase